LPGLRLQRVDHIAHVAATIASDPGLKRHRRVALARLAAANLQCAGGIVDRKLSALVFVEGDRHRLLHAIVQSKVRAFVRVGPAFACADRIGCNAIAGPRYRHQRRPSPRAVFAGVEAFAAQGVGDKRLRLEVQP
jgi:hypothetical protein